MTAEQKNRLDATISNSYNYNGKNITIERYKDVSGTNIVIFNSGPTLNILPTQLDYFLDSLMPSSDIQKTDVQIMVPKMAMATFEPTKENATIKETLLQTLEKIKIDPGYLPQASAICNVVSQMVAVQKNEIHMLGLINKFNQK